MSRRESTERILFGGADTKIWMTEPKTILFEKGDVKIKIKLVEFDYDTIDDHVLVDMSSNIPTSLIQTGLNIFKQNDFTKKIINCLKLNKRDLFRHMGAHRGRDVIILDLVKTLQTFAFGV